MPLPLNSLRSALRKAMGVGDRNWTMTKLPVSNIFEEPSRGYKFARANPEDHPVHLSLNPYPAAPGQPLSGTKDDIGYGLASLRRDGDPAYLKETLERMRGEPASTSVQWSGYVPSDKGKAARAKYGLTAMRNVTDALMYDARRFKPKRYSFYGATPKHDKLYRSLIQKMERSGYRVRLEPDGSRFTLTRRAPTQLQRIAQDLAATAPLGGLGYMALDRLTD